VKVRNHPVKIDRQQEEQACFDFREYI